MLWIDILVKARSNLWIRKVEAVMLNMTLMFNCSWGCSTPSVVDCISYPSKFILCVSFMALKMATYDASLQQSNNWNGPQWVIFPSITHQITLGSSFDLDQAIHFIWEWRCLWPLKWPLTMHRLHWSNNWPFWRPQWVIYLSMAHQITIGSSFVLEQANKLYARSEGIMALKMANYCPHVILWSWASK